MWEVMPTARADRHRVDEVPHRGRDDALNGVVGIERRRWAPFALRQVVLEQVVLGDFGGPFYSRIQCDAQWRGRLPEGEGVVARPPRRRLGMAEYRVQRLYRFGT